MRLPLPVASWTSTNPDHRILNVAHRGASARAPENTLAAIRTAIDLGADMVELDVQRSKDGVPVLMHDTTLARTTNVRRVFPRRGPWRVADFTYAELMRLDAGSWKAPEFAGERVATLHDAIEMIRRSGAGLLLEVKAPELYPGVIRDIVATMAAIPGYLDSATAAGRLVVQSFNFAAMKEHKTQAEGVPVGLLGSPDVANLPVLATWADQVNPSHLAADRSYVDQVHERGMACLVWTVNGGPAMRRALRMGVDGVITNRPAVLGRMLARRVRVPA